MKNLEGTYSGDCDFVTMNKLEKKSAEILNKHFKLEGDDLLTKDNILEEGLGGAIDCDCFIIEILLKELNPDLDMVEVQLRDDVEFDIQDKSIKIAEATEYLKSRGLTVIKTK